MKKILYILLVLLSFTVVTGCNNRNQKPEPDNGGETGGIDLSGVVFKDMSVVRDGKEYSIKATNLPEGVIPVYEGEPQTEVGTYVFKVKLFDSYGILLKELTATLTIAEKQEQNPEDIDLSGVVFESITINRDGEEHKIEATNLPQGVVPVYEGEPQTEVGTYEFKVKLFDSFGTLLKEMTATLTIVDKQDVQLPLV